MSDAKLTRESMHTQPKHLCTKYNLFKQFTVNNYCLTTRYTMKPNMGRLHRGREPVCMCHQHCSSEALNPNHKLRGSRAVGN